MKTWQLLKENPDLWPKYFIREKVLTAIRRFFLDREFHEVETPNLTGSLPPESYLEIFETTLYSRNHQKIKAYLPTSPEPFLKKLLVAGIGNCFAIPKSFRNTEDTSLTHNPEFTILEWYRINADYRDIMSDCEELFLFINTYLKRSEESGNSSLKNTELVYRGKVINLTPPWERLSVAAAFHKYAQIDINQLLTKENLAPLALKKGYKINIKDTWEQIFNLIFLNEVEPKLGRGKPTILYDYPIALAALSRPKQSDNRFAERFEFYIEGLELGDAYSELIDWREQDKRFVEESLERKRLGKVSHPIDTDFIEALKVGMPASGGIAVGVDRLIMLFADTTNIAETMFFPIKDLFP
jgi:elongation factor P--(R)-beta-lysine ligase